MTNIFVDTNILAYSRDTRDAVKQDLAERWIAALAHQRTGRISWQVLVEFYAVATHPRKLALAAKYAQADILALQAWNPVLPDRQLLCDAWYIEERYAFSWWDAQIVAAARQAQCSLLLSEDLQHGLLVDQTLTIVNPFAADAPAPPAAAH